MENDVLYNRIMNVVHEEYGEGSTAVANPEGEPTDDLTSIQIGDEIYGISGGGGGGMLIATVYFHEDLDVPALDKTYAEIVTSIKNEIPVYILWSRTWVSEGVTYEVNQLYPVSVCTWNSGPGGEYQVHIIGFNGGNNDTYFYSSTEDGVLVIGD